MTDPYRDDQPRADLIEDLMFHDAPAFVDRLERLVAECPELKPTVASACASR